jgi:hypothetical protein
MSDETTNAGIAIPIRQVPTSIMHSCCISAIPSLRWIRRRAMGHAYYCSQPILQSAEQCHICGKILWTDVPTVNEEEPKP